MRAGGPPAAVMSSEERVEGFPARAALLQLGIRHPVGRWHNRTALHGVGARVGAAETPDQGL